MVLGAQVISFHYRTQGLATDGGGNGGIVGFGNGFPGKNNSGGGGGGGVSLTSFVVISLISFYGAESQTVFYLQLHKSGTSIIGTSGGSGGSGIIIIKFNDCLTSDML